MLGVKRMPRPLSESRKPESRRKTAVSRGMRLRPMDPTLGFPGQPCADRERASAGLLCVSAVALLLSACTVGPDYQRPAAPVPAVYKEAGWKIGEPFDAIDRGAWWSVYTDP